MGIIPAYAGNTFSVTRKAGVWKDHPRVCGEHQKTKLDNTATKGIIPAYAGNTTVRAISAQEGRDHPRVCGEHFASNAIPACAWGSSPRMRGTPSHVLVYDHLIGIIPAYAGNTQCQVGILHSRGDHPRVCGEHMRCGVVEVRDVGSSPRMRGTPCDCLPQAGGLGIIPAYAGNTMGFDSVACQEQDQPRVCGEHSAASCICSSSSGSSPRMRGTRRNAVRSSDSTGIIPAYAGNTVRGF